MSEPTAKPEPDDQPAVLVLELRIPAGASYGDSPLPGAVVALNRAIEESGIEPATIVRMWAGIRETADAVAAIHWDEVRICKVTVTRTRDWLPETGVW